MPAPNDVEVESETSGHPDSQWMLEMQQVITALIVANRLLPEELDVMEQEVEIKTSGESLRKVAAKAMRAAAETAVDDPRDAEGCDEWLEANGFSVPTEEHVQEAKQEAVEQFA